LSSGAGLAVPGDRAALEQLGEQLGLLLEELFVVGQVVAEQRERFDARSAAEDDLGPAAGDRVQRGVPLEDPDRVVGAQHGDGRAEADLLGARRDPGEHNVACRHAALVRAWFRAGQGSAASRVAA